MYQVSIFSVGLRQYKSEQCFYTFFRHMLPEDVCADMAARKRHAQSKESITSQHGKKRHILYPKVPTEHNSMSEKGLLLPIVTSIV